MWQDTPFKSENSKLFISCYFSLLIIHYIVQIYLPYISHFSTPPFLLSTRTTSILFSRSETIRNYFRLPRPSHHLSILRPHGRLPPLLSHPPSNPLHFSLLDPSSIITLKLLFLLSHCLFYRLIFTNPTVCQPICSDTSLNEERQNCLSLSFFQSHRQFHRPNF